MIISSAAIPPVGLVPPAAGRSGRSGSPAGRAGSAADEPPLAVLFDRDGTLIHNVPYLADPEGVRPVAGARRALDRLRRRGVAGRRGQQPVRGGPRADQPRRAGAGSTRGSTSCSGPSTPGRSARTASTTAARAASRRPGWSSTAARELGVRPRPVRADRRHRSRRGRGAGGRGAGRSGSRRRRPEPAEIDRAGPGAAVAPTLGDAVRLSVGGPSDDRAGARPARGQVLIARLDSMGDVLLTGGGGPCGGRQRRRVTMLVGPRQAATGADAARRRRRARVRGAVGGASIHRPLSAGRGGGAGARASAASVSIGR